MRRMGWVAIVLAAAMLTTAAASARPRGRAAGAGRGGAGFCQASQWKDQLGLTDAQVADLQKECQANRDKRVAERGQAKNGWKAFNAALAADTLDENAARQASANLASAASDRVKAQADHMIAVRKILSAEQYRKYRDLVKAQVKGRVRDRVQKFRQRDDGAGEEEAF